MTANAKQNARPAKRRWTFRIAGLAVFLMALGVGWYYAWTHGARLLDNEVSALIRNSNDAGREIECANRRVEGFPFRVGIFCDTVSAYAVRDGISIRTGALRSAAQFYAPNSLIAEMDGPLTASTQANGLYTADWASMRASARVGFDGVNRISFQTRQLVLNTPQPGNGPRLVAKLEGGELHLRPTPGEKDANAVDLAFLLEKLEFSPTEGLPLPAFALSGDIRLDEMREELKPGFNLLDHLRARGISGEIRRAQIAPLDGGIVTLSGTFAISPAGRLSTSLDVESTDTHAIADFLGRVMPGQADLWQQIEQTIVLLARADSSGARKLRIEIENGIFLVGGFPVAEIPPLY